MPSTYSNLKIQLMATGENNSSWGDVTNVNIGAALGAAIASSKTITYANASQTLTWTDTNAPQDARFLRLNLTGTATAGYNLIVPTIGDGKPYIINNGTDGTITVKTAAGSGIAVPTGKTMWVYNDGTSVVDVVTHVTSLTSSNITTTNLTTTNFTATNATSTNATVTNFTATNATSTNATVTNFTTTNANVTGGVVTGVNITSSNLAASNAVTDTGTIAATSSGFRGLPQNSQTGAYTLALTDAGKHISITTGGIIIPANSSVAFPIGSAISIYNNSASSQTISITTDTMYLAGTASTGSRTLGQRGVATCLKVTSTTWVISGGGLA
jgi:hypothetical protein